MAKNKDKQKLINNYIMNKIDPMEFKKQLSYKEKDPAFMFYPNDFMSMTADLTDSEIGQFIKVFCYQFQYGHLTEKVINLRFPEGLSPDVMKKLEVDNDSNLYSPYLDKRIFERINYVTTRQENAKGKISKDETT